MKKFERLETATTPSGTVLELCRHDTAYILRVNGAELMSTRHHHSEDRLGEVVCEPLRGRAGARVLIGGLGFGFTLRAVLRELDASAEVVVAELMAEIIRWNLNEDYALSSDALRDPRVTVRHEDVMRVLADSPGSFDAIALDTDNGVDAMTTAENAQLYDDRGIRLAVAALRPGGTLAYWSASADARFVKALRRTGLEVRAEEVRTLATGGAVHSIYVASAAR